VELCDDAAYLVTRMGCISLCMPFGDVLELHDVMHILGLSKNLLSISFIACVKCVPTFDDRQVIIGDCNHESGLVLAKGV